MMETPVNAPIKEKLRLEVVKLREMNFKGKLEYIWDYYKIHIILIVIAIFVIFSFLNAWVFNPTPNTALFISWDGGFATDEQVDRLKTYLEERLIPEGKREEVIITQFFFASDDPMSMMTEVQRTAAMIAAGMIDFFIVDPDLFEEYSRFGYFLPLDEVLATIQAKNPEIYNRIEENIVSALFAIGEGLTESKAAGIRLSNSPLYLRLGFYRQELYIGISVTAERLDNIIETLMIFFEGH